MGIKVTGVNLLSAGYKEFNNHIKSKSTSSYIKSYQKRFDDYNGKKYYITIDEYDFSDFLYHNHLHRLCDNYKYSATAQFNVSKSPDSEQTFDVDFFIYAETTIEDMESFYDDIFYKMNCKHYERNGYNEMS